MDFEKNTLLFGSDPTPRIVAIELGETGTVKVYRREKDGSTAYHSEKFHPFLWADSDVADLGLTNAEKLSGDLKYNWLAEQARFARTTGGVSPSSHSVLRRQCGVHTA